MSANVGCGALVVDGAMLRINLMSVALMTKEERRRARDREYQSARYYKNRDAVLQKRKYDDGDPERYAKRLARAKDYWQRVKSKSCHAREDRRDGSRRYQLHRYGLTPEAFNQLLEQQASQCAICRRTLKPGNGTNVDHCHETGRVRGLLCPNCNKAIGLFGDDAEALSRASEYVRRGGVAR